MCEADALNEMDVIFGKLIHIAEIIKEESDVYIKPPDTELLECQQRFESGTKTRLGPGHLALGGSREWHVS